MILSIISYNASGYYYNSFNTPRVSFDYCEVPTLLRFV